MKSVWVTLKSHLEQSLSYLNVPIDSASLVFFRIVYGAILFVHLQLFFGRTRVFKYFNEPDILFPWIPFSWMENWLQPLPPAGMYLLYILALLSSLGIMLGFCYRISTVLFVVIYGYMHLLDIGLFFHHHFLVLFLGIILCFVPAHCNLSLDSKRYQIRATTRQWHGWLIRFQFGLVYFFAGVAKINFDWIFRGEPLNIHLNYFFDPLDGIILNFFHENILTTTVIVTIANFILIMELLAVPALLWQWTRKLMITLLVSFHILNHIIFPIGVFPALSVTGTLMFLSWNWPRKVGLFPEENTSKTKQSKNNPLSFKTYNQSTVAFFLLFFVLFQIFMPLRQYWQPGNRMWARNGFRLSWGMISTRRESFMQITAKIKGKIQKINYKKHLNNRQIAYVKVTPKALLRFAHFIGQRYDATAVHVYDVISLNGRPPALFLDPARNLLNVDTKDPVTNWIYPFPKWKPKPLPAPPMNPDLPNNHPLWLFLDQGNDN